MNVLCARLGIDFPLLQAGMGGVAGPELAAAVAQAGAGGVLALYRMRPDAISAALAQTRALTMRAFGVNLIPELMRPVALASQVEAVLADAANPAFFVFYGLPPDELAARVIEAGRALLVMVGDSADACRAAGQGASAVVLQGTEAGGHLLGRQRAIDLLVETRALVPDLPLLVAGGIGDGAQFRRFEHSGADGCLCGTLFVATQESRAHPRYQERIVAAGAADTMITGMFDVGWPDRPHRVLRNALTAMPHRALPTAFIASAAVGGAARPHPIARYSAMVPTRETQGSIDEMVMYCGESAERIDTLMSAGERVRRFVAEYRAARQAQTAVPSQAAPGIEANRSRH